MFSNYWLRSDVTKDSFINVLQSCPINKSILVPNEIWMIIIDFAFIEERLFDDERIHEIKQIFDMYKHDTYEKVETREVENIFKAMNVDLSVVC